MNIVERIKNIILKPKDEWTIISQESTSVQQLLTGYLLILALIPAFAQFIKFGFIGYNVPFIGPIGGSISYGIKNAVVSYLSTVGAVYLSALVIDALAPNFGSQKNFIRAMQLVVFSFTPMMIAGIFYLIPGLSILSILGLYGVYIMYLGFAPMMLTPEDKVTGYFVVSLLVTFAIYIVIGLILGLLLVSGSMDSAGLGM